MSTIHFPFGQDIAWQPNPDWIAQSNLQQFMDRHGISSYDELLNRSVEDIAWFWDAVMEDLDIRFAQPYSQTVDLTDGAPFARWCIGGKMNIIHNCLDKYQASATASEPALIFEGEEGRTVTLTYAQLHQEVCRCANALRSLGIRSGDAVGLYMPLIPELAVAFLAVIKIGGTVLPLFSGYGPSAIRSRLGDGGAKAVFVADGFLRRGRAVAMKSTLDTALDSVPSVRHVIVCKRLPASSTAAQIPWHAERDHWWHELVPPQAPAAETSMTSAEDPLMIIYTSGTTGPPKGAVHTHCGFPVKAAQDMRHAMDVKPGDRIYWMTDMGWMMGPWLVLASLLNRATMFFFDGAPDYPSVDRVWQLCARHRITLLGLSPMLVRALMPHGTDYVTRHDLSQLRAVGATGSPWGPSSWRWIFENVLEGRKPIFNYTGGTEISGGILAGSLFKPLKPAAFGGPIPGMDADVVDEAGNPVRGEVGDLIVRQPWIGMTRGFWRANDRYLDTYWQRFDGIWVHGDFCAIDEDDMWYILGRSDDTINIAGKRLGPAEVETLVNAHPDVTESAAVAVPHPLKDNDVVVFAVLKPGVDASEPLRTALQERITTELGRPLRPKEVRFCAALPKTRNAKVMHRLIRASYLGEDPGDISALEDPATLQAIQQSA